MEGQRLAVFGGPRPYRAPAGEGDLFAAKARLVAEHGAGAALAFQAMAHGNARWFTLDRKVKLPATAGGASGGHWSAPWLSAWTTQCRPDSGAMHERLRAPPSFDGETRFQLSYWNG